MEHYKILNNGSRIPILGYGTSIVHTYKYKRNYNKIDVAKYWAYNILKNKKQLKKDRAIKNGLPSN